MATAKELFDRGDLAGAIEALTQEVKVNPTDMQRRTFLFELLIFAGEYDRAERQLAVLGNQSVKAEIGVQVYHNNIKAMRDRRRLFTDGLQPHFLTEPPPYVDLHLDAINRMREGNYDEARALLDRAEEQRPAVSGTFNGEPFLDLRDYDDVVGPVLELIVQDKYTWLPFEQIRRIAIAPPKRLRDLMWAEARVEATNSTIGEVYVPTLYAGSSDHPDGLVRLGRKTEWEPAGGEVYRGVGLRLLLVDDTDRTIFEAKNVEFTSAEGDGEAQPS